MVIDRWLLDVATNAIGPDGDLGGVTGSRLGETFDQVGDDPSPDGFVRLAKRGPAGEQEGQCDQLRF